MHFLNYYYAPSIILTISYTFFLYYTRIRPLLLPYGPHFIFYLTGFNFTKYNPKFEPIKSVYSIPILMATAPIFLPEDLINQLTLINTAHEEGLPQLLKNDMGLVGGNFVNESHRLSELYEVHEHLRRCIKDTYRAGNYHVTNNHVNTHPLEGEVVPQRSAEAARLLDSNILQQIVEKHNTVISEIQGLHKNGVRCPESFKEDGTLMTRKQMFTTTYNSSILY